MKLKRKQIIDLWNKSALKATRKPFSEKRIPKFRLGDTIKIVTIEPDLGNWTWMDECRKEKKGIEGIVIDIGYVLTEVHSPFDYKILFEDGKEIVFVEEYLKKIKKRKKSHKVIKPYDKIEDLMKVVEKHLKKRKVS